MKLFDCKNVNSFGILISHHVLYFLPRILFNPFHAFTLYIEVSNYIEITFNYFLDAVKNFIIPFLVTAMVVLIYSSLVCYCLRDRKDKTICHLFSHKSPKDKTRYVQILKLSQYLVSSFYSTYLFPIIIMIS